jgi:hypothetical protein
LCLRGHECRGGKEHDGQRQFFHEHSRSGGDERFLILYMVRD